MIDKNKSLFKYGHITGVFGYDSIYENSPYDIIMGNYKKNILELFCNRFDIKYKKN